MVHHANVKHQIADALSWLQTTGDHNSPLEDDLRLLAADEKGDDTSTPFINTNSDDIISLIAQKKKSFGTPPTVEKRNSEQALDNYGKVASFSAGYAGSEFNIDQRELFVRQFIVARSIRVVALILHQARILYLAHHRALAEHLRQRRMYDMARHAYHWPHLTTDV